MAQAVNVDSERDATVKRFRDKLNDLQNIFKKVSEKKSSNAQDEDDFSNLKAGILLLYIEAVSFFVPDKKWTQIVQSGEPLSPVSPSLQQEIFEAEEKSKISTYASVPKSTSTLRKGQSELISRAVTEKKINSKVVLNGAGKNSNLEIVGKMPKRKAIFLSRLGTSATVNDITNYLSSLKLQYLQRNRLKTKFQSYASFHIEVYECDLPLILDASFWPEGCLITEVYGKFRKDQISQAVTSESVINNLPESNFSTPTVSK
ncbi:hypothetical protein AVEN_11615-1 [Araneus ventricosus]|uniref:Uncharacterized protein n=1 Tax=Araneus ventricosus TaxID=182803 RepID=A0A4Y2SBN6_ARAVE|nr:hypothetical protein AVEN_11615-1 [Araneus ventricosus]